MKWFTYKVANGVVHSNSFEGCKRMWSFRIQRPGNSIELDVCMLKESVFLRRVKVRWYRELGYRCSFPRCPNEQAMTILWRTVIGCLENFDAHLISDKKELSGAERTAISGRNYPSVRRTLVITLIMPCPIPPTNAVV